MKTIIESVVAVKIFVKVDTDLVERMRRDPKSFTFDATKLIGPIELTEHRSGSIKVVFHKAEIVDVQTFDAMI